MHLSFERANRATNNKLLLMEVMIEIVGTRARIVSLSLCYSILSIKYPVSAFVGKVVGDVGEALFSRRMKAERDRHLQKDSEVIGMQMIWIEQ